MLNWWLPGSKSKVKHCDIHQPVMIIQSNLKKPTEYLLHLGLYTIVNTPHQKTLNSSDLGESVNPM